MFHDSTVVLVKEKGSASAIKQRGGSLSILWKNCDMDESRWYCHAVDGPGVDEVPERGRGRWRKKCRTGEY